MEPVPLYKVMEMLTQVSTERPLPREAAFALQHAEAALKTEPKVVADVYTALKELPFLSPYLVTKLVDVVPDSAEDVRLVLPKDRLPLDEAQIQTVIETITKCL